MLPSSVLGNKTSFETLLGHSPSYIHMKVFGCLYASALCDGRNKFSSRAIKCAFIGCPFGKKTYNLYELQSSRVFYSRDVVFYESIFPFESISNLSIANTPIIPTCPEFDPVIEDIMPPLVSSKSNQNDHSSDDFSNDHSIPTEPTPQ